MKNSKTLKTIILLSVIITFSTDSFSQTPCTGADAYQKVGSWGKQAPDSLANADPSFPKDQYKPVLAKAQKVIELLQKANPQPVGIQATAYRGIGRGSGNGPLPFEVTARYFGFLCMLDTPGDPDRGLIMPGGETSTAVTISFNNLNPLENIPFRSLGKDLRTVEGETIFLYPKEIGEIQGLPLLLSPDYGSNGRYEAVVIAPGNQPFLKPITREQFLQAMIKSSKRKIKKRQDELKPNDKYALEEIKSEENKIAKIEAELSRMSPNERQLQAIIASEYDSLEKLFVPASDERGRRLVKIDKSVLDLTLPRETIQFITVHWRWREKERVPAELIRQFKQNFDFAALRQMLGK